MSFSAIQIVLSILSFSGWSTNKFKRVFTRVSCWLIRKSPWFTRIVIPYLDEFL